MRHPIDKNERDPYRWLEKTETPRVQKWIQKEASGTEDYFTKLPLRKSLRKEFTKLATFEHESMPKPRQGNYFFMKRYADENFSSLYVKKGLHGKERKLIDAERLAKTKKAVLYSSHPSPDGKYVLYGISKSANDKRSYHILAVATGKSLKEIIPEDSYPIFTGWNASSTGFWYMRRNPGVPKGEEKFHRRAFFHELGTPVAHDVKILGDGEAKETYSYVRDSDDGRYLIGFVEGDTVQGRFSEVHIKDTEEATGRFICVFPREYGIECDVQIHRGMLYILTNKDAPYWKVIAISVSEALHGSRSFTTIVRMRAGRMLERFDLVKDRMFISHLYNVHGVLEEYDLCGKKIRTIPQPTLGTLNGFTYEDEGNELFFGFHSFAVPPTTYRINLVTNAVMKVHQDPIAIDTSDVVVNQAWCASKDGTKVPVFIVHKKGLRKNGKNPTVLYGYGGFNLSAHPSFSLFLLPFLRRGGVYAVANIRGGGEFGKTWHEAAIQYKRQNAFDDFAAAIEFLKREKYTDTGHLAIRGGSNGGLLVTTTMTQHPGLVKAVVAHVPVTDMLRYHLHLGGRYWINDYGDPDDPKMRKYLLSYSPYHNVKNGVRYPATLIMTGASDDRVHPLHSFKFYARLKKANASSNPVLLRIERNTGHGGAVGVAQSVKQDADMWAFIFHELGMDEKAA